MIVRYVAVSIPANNLTSTTTHPTLEGVVVLAHTTTIYLLFQEPALGVHLRLRFFSTVRRVPRPAPTPHGRSSGKGVGANRPKQPLLHITCYIVARAEENKLNTLRNKEIVGVPTAAAQRPLIQRQQQRQNSKCPSTAAQTPPPPPAPGRMCGTAGDVMQAMRVRSLLGNVSPGRRLATIAIGSGQVGSGGRHDMHHEQLPKRKRKRCRVCSSHCRSRAMPMSLVTNGRAGGQAGGQVGGKAGWNFARHSYFWDPQRPSKHSCVCIVGNMYHVLRNAVVVHMYHHMQQAHARGWAGASWLGTTERALLS